MLTSFDFCVSGFIEPVFGVLVEVNEENPAFHR